MDYVRRRAGLSTLVFLAVVAGAASAVGLQYSLKLLIDALSASNHDLRKVSRAGALFLGMIAIENLFWRVGSWLGSRTVVTNGGDLRLDLFQYLIVTRPSISPSTSAVPWPTGSARRDCRVIGFGDPDLEYHPSHRRPCRICPRIGLYRLAHRACPPSRCHSRLRHSGAARSSRLSGPRRVL